MNNRDWLFVEENRIHNFRSVGVLLHEGKIQTDESRLIFQWVDINELLDYKVYPEFLKNKISNLADGVEHFVTRD
ncbi:hypothetical protein P40081_18810 [Paenibacillus sp. FSL P4-0081]|uniref:hypothetical protein n=1 Tax=Paenibacillus sp. FSL P4-0081 TaxID=1536769 RepID=UPI0004F6A855|nr:hypothetical protein [Paenibacillus sp. FSL P4-0081]AIQ29983.1 hypothetical protein P40081_18810 [Paenibacillus sp. FSL P4-0081]